MSLVRCLSLRSVLNARRYRSSYSCLIPLETHREEDATRQTPAKRSYHSLIHLNSVNGGSDISRNLTAFNSPGIASYRSISTFNFAGSGAAAYETAGILADWVLQSGVNRAYALQNVADALASLQHLLTLLHSFTFSQWWVCIIVTSLLIRGVTIPVMIDLLSTIVKFFKNGNVHVSLYRIGIAQGEALNENYIQASVLGRSGRVMYTMLEKEFHGVKGSIIGEGIQVPVFWFSMEELKQNMDKILLSCLRGKTFAAELIKNRVLSKGRLVVVVGDGFGLELQMFDLDFSLILRRRQVKLLA